MLDHRPPAGLVYDRHGPHADDRLDHGPEGLVVEQRLLADVNLVQPRAPPPCGRLCHAVPLEFFHAERIRPAVTTSPQEGTEASFRAWSRLRRSILSGD